MWYVESSFWGADKGKNQIFDWFSKSKVVWPLVEDAECSGCLLASKIGENVHQVKELVLKKRMIIICEGAKIGNYVWVSSEHFQRQSECAWIAIQFMPCLLNVEQKESLGLPKKASKGLKDFSEIITAEET